jgi:hypothetical protein
MVLGRPPNASVLPYLFIYPSTAIEWQKKVSIQKSFHSEIRTQPQSPGPMSDELEVAKDETGRNSPAIMIGQLAISLAGERFSSGQWMRNSCNANTRDHCAWETACVKANIWFYMVASLCRLSAAASLKGFPQTASGGSQIPNSSFNCVTCMSHRSSQ